MEGGGGFDYYIGNYYYYLLIVKSYDKRFNLTQNKNRMGIRTF